VHWFERYFTQEGPLFLAFRFIGPFLPAVQKWEKTLSLISEVLDEWILVQRKWIYLEEIFAGGDIRQQLPDESRNFDDIDKAFERVL
jgi:dynein heavy chain